MSKSKKLVRCYQSSCGWDVDGKTIEQTIRWLQEQEGNIKELYPEVVEVSLHFEPDDYDPDYRLNICGFRPETDKEEKKRLQKEADDKARREHWDLQQLARLKKQYEK